jgi:hypothetical protein
LNGVSVALTTSDYAIGGAKGRLDWPNSNFRLSGLTPVRRLSTADACIGAGTARAQGGLRWAQPRSGDDGLQLSVGAAQRLLDVADLAACGEEEAKISIPPGEGPHGLTQRNRD